MSELFERFLRVGDELEVTTRQEFVAGASVAMVGPPLPYEAYEWMALFSALEDASETFTMVELGAGFGRWTVRAAAATRRYRPELRYRLVAVEAEPTHFEWLQQHIEDNEADSRRAGRFELVNAAVSTQAGEEDFYFGDPAEWYGQALVRPENVGADAAVRSVRTVTLRRLLRRLDSVDLIDIDIQGAELEVLSDAEESLEHVGRVYVETHSPKIDAELAGVFERARGAWSLVVAVPLGARQRTPLGDSSFEGGGAQLWRNDARRTRRGIARSLIGRLHGGSS